MTRTAAIFAVVGGLGVPAVFTLLGWALHRLTVANSATTLALLHDVQLPLWPMSKLILDDPSGRHWLYLPLAAVLSNALLYAAVGLLAGWGRRHRAGFPAAVVVAPAMLLVAWQGFGTGGTGFAIATALALGGLLLHRFAPFVRKGGRRLQ